MHSSLYLYLKYLFFPLLFYFCSLASASEHITEDVRIIIENNNEDSYGTVYKVPGDTEYFNLTNDLSIRLKDCVKEKRFCSCYHISKCGNLVALHMTLWVLKSDFLNTCDVNIPSCNTVELKGEGLSTLSLEKVNNALVSSDYYLEIIQDKNKQKVVYFNLAKQTSKEAMDNAVVAKRTIVSLGGETTNIAYCFR